MTFLDLGLRGKCAVVTGGSRGIGRAVSLRLAEAGMNVVINYVSDPQAARMTAADAAAYGVGAIEVKADVRELKQAQGLIQRAHAGFGSVDVVVCNAGVWRGAAVEEISERLWQEVLDINLKGTWTVCSAVVPYMKAARAGKIIIVSSTAGQRGEANYSNYAASKGGQISFTKSLAIELAPYDVNVNCVAPGWVETEMNTVEFDDAERRRAIENAIPLKRIATADDIARPVLFLASSWASHLTGEILNVNGGSVLCG